jgi:hypothetical protein
MNLRTGLEEVLDDYKARMHRLGATEPTGYSRAEVTARSAALSKPLPAEVQRFYETVRPDTWGLLAKERQEPSLDPLEQVKWMNSFAIRGEEEDLRWEDAPLGPREPAWLIFGNFEWGDPLVWCEESQWGHSRSILFVYMDGRRPMVLGESLAQWLERLLCMGGVEYADDEKGLLQSALSKGRQNEFVEAHVALNPHEHDRWKSHRP